MKMAVFWVRAIIALMMEAASTSETSGKLLPDYTAQQPRQTAIFLLLSFSHSILSGVLS
jgi:hypothetical protein